VRDGEVRPSPSQEFNDNEHDADPEALVSVQSVVVDPADRLWILDTGSPMMSAVSHGGPKLVCVDLSRDQVVKRIVVDLDSGESWRRLHDHPGTKGLTPPDLRIVVEGEQFLNRSEDGTVSPIAFGSDGIAISADGERNSVDRRLPDGSWETVVHDVHLPATVGSVVPPASAGSGATLSQPGLRRSNSL